MDVIVRGRNVVVPDHYREHVTDKLHKIERYDQKIIEVSVELTHEPNPRQSESCQRVEITCVSRGPVVRAEACANDFYSALDKAVDKLVARMRRAADRRRVHHGRHAPVSVAAATAPLLDNGEAGDVEFAPIGRPSPTGVVVADREFAQRDGRHEQSLAAAAEGLVPQADDQPWHIARTKAHEAEPMTIDDALFQMELVGHDFYLFLDKNSGRPSVVYRRRKGYDYGVISLAEPPRFCVVLIEGWGAWLEINSHVAALDQLQRHGTYRAAGAKRTHWISSMRVPSGPGSRAR